MKRVLNSALLFESMLRTFQNQMQLFASTSKPFAPANITYRIGGTKMGAQNVPRKTGKHILFTYTPHVRMLNGPATSVSASG